MPDHGHPTTRFRRLKYQSHYGYPFRWALLAEIAWRLEHLLPGGPFYRWRKALERRGWEAYYRG